jgi:hypothetical protein
MTQWTFFGRVLPERIPLKVALPEWTSELTEFGLRYRVTVQIADGQFVVPVIIESGQIDVHTLRNLVENDIRIATDLIGYLIGGSFDVDIISATSDAGPSVVFGIKVPVLEEVRGTQTTSIESDLLNAVAQEIPARLVLADFREAIRNPAGTGFFSYRAVEAMMQSMKAHPDDKDGPAWEKLRDRLEIDRSFIDEIKKHAKYPRHGKVTSIDDADRAKVFRLTDQIVRRYLEFLRRRKTPLSASEFPLLVYP